MIEALTQSELKQAAAEAFYSHAKIAHDDPIEFNAFVLRDEETGTFIENGPNHELMHAVVDESDRAIIIAHIESGKSNAITIGRTLWELGHNLNMRGAILSATQPNAVKFLRPIKNYIDQSRECRAVFPDLRRGPVWQETQIIVDRPNKGAKDPSLQALGIETEILGARLDYLVIDDLLNHANTRTKHQRDEVFDKLHSTLFGRMTRNAKIIFLGTAWHKHDALHRLARRKLWFCCRFPVESKDPVTGERVSNWPERWSLERIDQERELLGPLEAQKQLDVKPFDDSENRFKEEHIQKCLNLGRGLVTVSTLDQLRELPQIGSDKFNRGDGTDRRPGAFAPKPRIGAIPVLHGIDLAGKGRSRKSGETVIFSLGLHPNGRRQVLRVRSGKWDGPRIVDEIIATHRDLGGLFMVENNGVQQWILEFVDEREVVPLYPFTTGNNKAHPEYGVETLATEFSREGWIVPAEEGEHGLVAADEQIALWLDELREYQRDEHTGDRMMASWFAREAARRLVRSRKPRGVGVRKIG
jgi:hypothetical protein